MKVSAKKRFLAWITALLMVVTYMPALAYADDVNADPGVETTAVETEPAEEAVDANTANEATTDEDSGTAVASLGTVDLLDGKISIDNTGSSASLENGVVTVTAKAPATAIGKPETNYVTIYNETDSQAVLKFDYAASNFADFSETNSTGTYKKVLEAKDTDGDSVKLYITAGTVGSGNAVLEMSNFSLEAIADSYDITVKYNELGSVTADGESIASGTTKEVTHTDGIELTATPANGAEFLGWINGETCEFYTKEATYAINPTANETLEAVFINADSKAHYLVADKYLINDFKEATDKALGMSKKVVALMNDATLTAGEYEVPAGVTLLIPFDDKNTLYTDVPKGTHDAYKTPVAYRTLTMADGAKLIVNGAVSLSAMQYAANGGGRGSGAPTGDVSFLDLKKGSSVTVNDGAYLYAYGYIVGEGTVTAKDGATIFENFQIEDFRGGTATTNMAADNTLPVEGSEEGANHGVLPLSQYYVQNIEVPLTLEAGAVEYTYTSIFMENTLFGAAVAFISDRDAMFNLTSGNVTKSYDGSTDRLIVEGNGVMSLSPITVSLKDKNINSKEFELPINSNITVKISSGDVEINQDLALLPGSQIIIGDGATCALNNANVYVYDADQWSGYCGSSNKPIIPITYAPGKKYDREGKALEDAAVLVNGTLDASEGFIYTTTNSDFESKFGNIYSSGNGKIITVTGPEYYTYQYVQNDSSPYKNICILPATLKNEDGTYIQTLGEETAATYTYTEGVWVCNHKNEETVTKEPTCTEIGTKTVVCELGHEYKLTVPATGHVNTIKTAAKAATCTEDGNEAYWTCSDCGKMFLDSACTKETEDPSISMLNHDLTQHEAKAATCTGIGWDAYVSCGRCDYTTYKEIAALGHNAPKVEAKTPTCTVDGNKEYWYCDKCEVYFADKDFLTSYDGKPVIAAAHDMENFDEVPATCTEAGSRSGGKCKNCDYTEGAGVIAPLGHDKTRTAAKAATCTEDGNIDYWTCAICEKSFSDEACTKEVTAEGTVVKAKGHELKHNEAVAATCTAGGNDEYWSCEVCSKLFADAEGKNSIDAVPVTKALGHDLAKIEAVAATCTEDGNKEYWLCGTCGKMYEDEDCDTEFTTIPVLEKTGHTETTLRPVNPTCDETGLTAGKKCTVCGEITLAQEEVPSLGGHKWDKGTVIKLPGMVKNTSGDLEYASGKIKHVCENTGCKEEKEVKLDWGQIKTYDEFVTNLEILEDWAFEYAIDNNIEDPAALVIRYVRTGVDRYNSGSWEIMAGFDNTKFTDYVTTKELEINNAAATDADKVNVTGLKNISNFTLYNDDYVDFGHMFGTIDISYTNKTSINHADVAGFFGDTTDLLTTAINFEVRGTVKEMVKDITDNYFLKDAHWDDKFGYTDMLGDLDGYYLNRELLMQDYEKGMLTELIKAYFTEDLTEEERAAYYLTNRLQCGSSKAAIRDAVYTAYCGNSVIATLEGTRDLKNKVEEDILNDLRRAACYTVADYICNLAGDYTADIENDCYTVTSEQFATLAPGITQEIKTAVMDYVEDGQPVQYDMKYYIATADITREDVSIYANYPTRPIEKVKDENGKDQYVWSRKTVLEQALAAQETYGNPESELYKPNFNVVASTNADGFDMTGDSRGEPGGLLIMDGEEIAPITNNGFFGILEDGTAVIGTANEYNNIYRGKIKEAVGGFGSMLVKDGKIVATSRGGFAPRTAVGITASGKVVMMVLDGRQPGGVSNGGDMLDIAHIMYEAGCVEAINLDGGGSSTYVAKQPGDDEITLVSSPSDGYPRALGSSLMAVSTAKSSTVFDHAVLNAPTNCMTVGSEMQMTASGVTSTGNAVDIPVGATWTVNDEDKEKAAISADGKLKALKTGAVHVNLMLDGVPVGQKTINVVIPDKITFTKASVDVVYESSVTLPIKAYYEGKAVTINAGDFEFTVSEKDGVKAGEMSGLDFIAGVADTGIRNCVVTAAVKENKNITAKVTVKLYNQGENTFDFDKKTGGSKEFAWLRTVTNGGKIIESKDGTTYYAEDKNSPMETDYVFAIDMTEIPIPEVLEELTDMLPGNDVEGACAWTYLCNLAQRISDISEVTATVKIDDNFELVNPEKITVKNEYFKLKDDGSGVEYDKDTNTLTLRLNWVRQYSPIDLEMADPLCLVNGIKLMPRNDADWGSDNTINVINKGDISYDVYMRASSLYTFSNDKDNQAKYGLKPFSRKYIDKDGVEQSESGGGFGSTYKEFADSYTLVKEKTGWIVEEGGWRYYKDGEYLTGIQQVRERIDGQYKSLYYDFGTDGVIKGNEKKTYSGLIVNEGIAGKKTYSYATYGELTGGWVKIGEDWHYFDPTAKVAVEGKRKIVVKSQSQSSAIDAKPITIEATVEYEFDDKGKVVGDGTWLTDQSGNKYYMNGTWFENKEMDNKTYFYYGPGFVCRQWGEKDGKKVYFAMEGHLLNNNIVRIREDSNRPAMYHMFDENGYWVQMCEGFVEWKGSTFYYPTEEQRMSGEFPEDVQDWDAEGDVLKYGRAMGLQKIDGKYYYFKPHKDGEGYGGMLTGKRTVEHGIEGACTIINFDKSKGGYAVDANGKPLTDLTHVMVSHKVEKATFTEDGVKAGTHCTNCGEGKEHIAAIKSVTLSYDRINYNGKVQKPEVNVLDKNGAAITSSNYSVKYGTGCKNVGRYKVTVTFKGNYSGTKTLYYTIVPKAPTSATARLRTVSGGYDDVYFSWKKSTGASGYYVYYKKSTATKYTYLTATTKTTYTKKNLSDGVKYTFQVIPYYKNGSTKYKSTSSKVSSVYTLKKVSTPKVVKSGTKVKVSWTNIEGETGYQISRAAKKSGTNIVSTFKTTTGKSKTVKAQKGKKFYYKVRAYKTVNGKKVFGPWSYVKGFKR